MIRLGIDTGGTFTDFVLMEPGQLRVHKVLSTPANPALAIIQGLKELGVFGQEIDLIHGSTVATNALLERRGARLAFITTSGFEDLLTIGRQTRRELYNLMVEERRPLVDREFSFGLPERIGYDGKIIRPLDASALEQLVKQLKQHRIESVAVCFLHSYVRADHERKVGQRLAQENIHVSLSSDILPEYREFERASTTAINAYVAPLMERYLRHLEQELGEAKLKIMQSNGGCLSAKAAREKPVTTILSGPAGGVVGASAIAFQAGFRRLISFDMGGTSTDVSLCDGAIMTTTETEISHLPLKIPVIDIHSVGSGGGSIAYLDEGGALRVGPRSAGAEPGPICYGKGQEITVTDANLVLGRLEPKHFLGGQMKLFPERSFDAIEKLADQLKLKAEELAEGIVRVADATMERAIRVISVERGYDPRDFALVSFGGAGGMHACNLAERLRIPLVLVPKNAGVLSALGMLLSDVVKDYSRSVLLKAEAISFNEINELFKPLLDQAIKDLTKEGFSRQKIRLLRYLDTRYVGQSYELTVPASSKFRRDFDRLHLRRYNYADESRPVEIVNLRVKAIGLTDKPPLPKLEKKGKSLSSAMLDERVMIFDGQKYKAKIYNRQLLEPGHFLAGPAVIMDYESTAVLPPNWQAQVDAYGHLIMRMKRK
ncbi:MAG: hydantoinase/oxoprolinase family protein [Candidatus Aminicenantes bacterium]|nr:hydantoinase/oxoprolinase family protein [Candidatus Aminicenantes bacterium]